ncbi:MAG: hypothetical protein ABIR81_01610, partial [Ginsengibacter sp.]
MPYLLFFIYLLLFCWLITKIKFFKASGIGNKNLIILFLLRVLAALANGWISLFYYGETDSTFFHKEGIIEYHLLLSDPKTYLTNIFYNYNRGLFGGLMDISNSFWNNLKSNVIIKLLSIFNIFSNTHYFINALFYNFLVFFGSVALYRSFKNIAPQKNFLVLPACFLLPSTLYFSSGIHKDGLVFLSLSIVCFSFFKILRGRKSIGLFVTVFFGLAMIFVLRSFVLVTLLPVLIAWLLCEKIERPRWMIFASVYFVFIVCFFGIGRLFPNLDLPKIVADRQAAFVEISKKSNSQIESTSLQPTFKSFAENAPKAISNVLLRPTLFEIWTPLYIPLAVETTLYVLAVIVFIFFPEKK